MNEIQQTALQRLGIEALTPMQEAMLACTGEPGDILLLSPTGSGKTLAYLLPLIEQFNALTANPSPLTINPYPSAIVVVPSRELAQQIESVWKQMGTPWKALSVYGGRPAMEEHRTLREVRPALIVGTPGRLNDHLQKGNIDAAGVHTLVLDEYD
ncbi:MAG: DEAD/DEAH box helicase, partial [Bacteroidaceae bacterium]|nr:DEAD/DEAH box helicase [Bacteroidaceae bacterium]